MSKPFFFLWLNDTSPSRYYWNQSAQNWTTSFDHATKFPHWDDAATEANYAELSTTAEVIIDTRTETA